jgi:hypothetical protein
MQWKTLQKLLLPGGGVRSKVLGFLRLRIHARNCPQILLSSRDAMARKQLKSTQGNLQALLANVSLQPSLFDMQRSRGFGAFSDDSFAQHLQCDVTFGK